jgi:hypothetical protein
VGAGRRRWLESQENEMLQIFFCCKHHPIALWNFWRGRMTCAHGCHKEPLKWFDNGRHREPGK